MEHEIDEDEQPEAEVISDHPDQEAVKVVRIQARMSDKGVETTPVRARWPRIRWPTTPWLKRDGGHQECPSERRDKEGMGGLDGGGECSLSPCR